MIEAYELKLLGDKDADMKINDYKFERNEVEEI